jgi:hypothetical protein
MIPIHTPFAALIEYPIRIHLENGSIVASSFITQEAVDLRVTDVRGVVALMGIDPSQVDFLEFDRLGQWSIKACHSSHLGLSRYHLVLQPRTGQVPAINRSEVSAQLDPLATELIHARTKFPGNQFMFAALMEEIGEMADTWATEGDTAHARHEALQVACVAMRIATEGVDRTDEDPQTLITLAALEAQARDFFASIKSRPDLSARS